MNLFRDTRGHRKTAVAAALIALVAAPLLSVQEAAAAIATEVDANPNSGTLTVQAAPNRANVITIEREGDTLIVSDDGDVVLSKNDKCLPTTPLERHKVRCLMLGLWRIDIFGNDSNDKITFNALDDFGVMEGTLHGGEGEDTLTLGPASGPGVLRGGPGNDILVGGNGNDRLHGDAGADRFAGGDGIDVVDYSDRVARVAVTIGSPLQDGEQGENDNVLEDVENVIGGASDDLLFGNAADNQFWGGAGNDVLRGGPGNDVLSGNDGRDELRGDVGRDQLFGNGGDDRMDGGPGVEPDVFNGGDGVDVASYEERQDAVSVDNDSAFDDGAPAEGDTVAPNVENLQGGAGDDQLRITAAANATESNNLDGGPGNDRLDIRDGGPRDVANGGSGTGDACGIDIGDSAILCELS